MMHVRTGDTGTLAGARGRLDAREEKEVRVSQHRTSCVIYTRHLRQLSGTRHFSRLLVVFCWIAAELGAL